MKIYADTSALVAWFYPADEFAPAVTAWFGHRSFEFCWNPLLRIELRHQLRKLAGGYAATAWQAYRAGETSRKLTLESPRLSELLEWTDELSARYAQKTRAGTWDFVHVALAQHAQTKTFVTCDAAQAELARLAGMVHVQLFK